MINFNPKLRFYIAILSIFLYICYVDARGGGRGGGRRGGFRGRGIGGGGFEYKSFENVNENVNPINNSSSKHSEPDPSPYGNTFIDNGPPENSYLYNNYYRNWDTNEFLISSLFYTAGMQKTDPTESKNFYKAKEFEDFYRKWNDEQDKEWRASTKAPYFENKIPGQQRPFPASAVVEAATAFGLVSLLPLNVPNGNPLMYYGTTELIQSPIMINNKDTYICKNNTIFQLSCQSEINNDCKLEEFKCDLKEGNRSIIYCTNGTLLSSKSIICNSTTSYHKNDLNNKSIVKCYEGQLPKSQTSFIPTTTPASEDIKKSATPTTPKPLSVGANVHILLLKLIGKSEVLETSTDSNAWKPEALTISLETITEESIQTTTKEPFVWMELVNDNITGQSIYQPIPKHFEGNNFPFDVPSNWFKVYTTSTEKYVETTTKSSNRVRKTFEWKRKHFAPQNHSEYILMTVTQSEIEIAEQFNCVPSNWVKVPIKKNRKSTTPEP